MKTAPLFKSLLLLAVLAFATTAALAGNGRNCDTGSHFSYGPLTPYAQWTFTGTGGSITTNFQVTAPSGTGFPVGNPPRDCAPTATANLEATEVTKVADANGNAIDPISEDDTPLGDAISASFLFAPNPWANFAPGDNVTIVVTVMNPNVAPADYGDYDVKLAAHDNGSGIGVGNGPHFTLKLRAQPCQNTVPDVTITKLAGDPPGVLGTVPLSFTARDVCDAIQSVSASVTSAGGAVNQTVPLNVNPSLPFPTLTTGTASGSFTPYGGAGSPGTSDAAAFTDVSGNRSGIGNYTITAQATDQGNSSSSDTWSFDVNYAVTFTKQSVPAGCTPVHTGACHADIQFTVTRSTMGSDGAFMYDHTVVVVLYDGNNNVIATHPYGMASVLSYTQIDPNGPVYLTTFPHPGGLLRVYHAVVYFRNVDGSLIAQATSVPLAF